MDPMDEGVLARVRNSLESKRDVLRDWARSAEPEEIQETLGPSSREALERHLSVIDTALEQVGQGDLGTCVVCHEPVESRLIQMDYTACVCIEHFSDAERRNLENELELAGSVQRSLLPQEAPTFPHLEIAAFSRPAQIVGGDYFDFFPFAGGRQGLTISDVAGHGMSSSLIMASLQTMLRTLTQDHQSPAELVERINRLCIHNIQFTTFVTLFLGAFEPNERRLTYCNAGHNPPMLVRASADGWSDIEWLAPTGAAVGLTEDSGYADQAVALNPGDLLVLYTDGVTEATDPLGEFFGPARLATLVRDNAAGSAHDLVHAIRDGLGRFGGGATQADDVTVVVMRVVD
jgi:sigma-B regulation protein RsbU (phosphoserine phosphatase)